MPGLFSPASIGVATVVLAVSGGIDSMALMHLAIRWRDRSIEAGQGAPQLIVATVDHGLRAGSAEEAEWVRARAEALGLAHHTLAWTGPKPVSGIQAAARAERYRLLAELASRLPLQPIAVAVAHHQDDQAETVLMRLSRGSGVDGLGGMDPDLPMPGTAQFDHLDRPSVRLIRPLLDIPKARLEATLRELGETWREDPSNAMPRFERVRVRQVSAALGAAGLTNAQVATSARRLRRARAALEAAVRELSQRVVDDHDGIFATLNTAAFLDAPEELRVRLIQRLLAAFGGVSAPARMSEIEAMVEHMAQPEWRAATLGGCALHRSGDGIAISREVGRDGLPVLQVAPGQSVLWDNRFVVSVTAQVLDQSDRDISNRGDGRPKVAVTVRALTAGELSSLLSGPSGSPVHPGPNRPVPRAAALTLPSFWRARDLIAVPHLQVANRSDAALACAVRPAHFLAR